MAKPVDRPGSLLEEIGRECRGGQRGHEVGRVVDGPRGLEFAFRVHLVIT